MKGITTSIRLPPALRERLEEVARRTGRGKNWLIVQALEAYLAVAQRKALAREARRQSLLASETAALDESYWEGVADHNDWRG